MQDHARAVVDGLVANGKVRDVKPNEMYVCQQQARLADAEASVASALAPGLDAVAVVPVAKLLASCTMCKQVAARDKNEGQICAPPPPPSIRPYTRRGHPRIHTHQTFARTLPFFHPSV